MAIITEAMMLDIISNQRKHTLLVHPTNVVRVGTLYIFWRWQRAGAFLIDKNPKDVEEKKSSSSSVIEYG